MARAVVSASELNPIVLPADVPPRVTQAPSHARNLKLPDRSCTEAATRPGLPSPSHSVARHGRGRSQPASELQIGITRRGPGSWRAHASFAQRGRNQAVPSRAAGCPSGPLAGDCSDTLSWQLELEPAAARETRQSGWNEA